MKIVTKAVFQMTDDGLELLEKEEYDYDGPVALCKGGGGGDIPERQTVVSEPWWGATEHLYKVMKHGEYYADWPMTYPKETYAQFDPLETQAQQAMLDYDPSQQIAQAQQAQSQMLSAPDVASNTYVQGMGDVIQGRLNRNLEENILPAIGRKAISRGQFGGSRQGVAEGIAARGTQEAYGDALSQLQLGAYDKGLESQARGMAFTPQTIQQGLFPAQQMGQVGQMRREMAEQGIDEDVARHEFQQMEPWQRLQLYNSLIHGGDSSTTTSGLGGGGDSGGFDAGGAIGGAMTGYGLATGGLFGGAAGGAGGAIGGAAAGATMGSVVPIVGTALGAIVGGLFG